MCIRDSGYIEQERSVHDKRSIKVSLSDKGKELYEVLNAMFTRHESKLEGTKLSPEALASTIDTLQNIERFWNAQTQASAMED